jgi:histidinol dehydrogenase
VLSKNSSFFIAPVDNHRKREKGIHVYPVYSRRSGGLSVGINLFPDQKRCSFDCPYCEVFPFSSNDAFSSEQMEEDLRNVISGALEQNVPVRDICFSGNGEPTLSPDFPEALEMAGRIRAGMVPEAELVLITNGSGLLEEKIFSLLRETVFSHRLDIWLKLDAGTAGWYEKMSRSKISFEKLTGKIKEFVSLAPVTIQTMLCAIDGESPPPEETAGWEKLVLELAASALAKEAGVRKVQIYGKARPAPEDPKAQALPVEFLEKRAESLRAALAAANAEALAEKNWAAGKAPKVEVYP